MYITGYNCAPVTVANGIVIYSDPKRIPASRSHVQCDSGYFSNENQTGTCIWSTNDILEWSVNLTSCCEYAFYMS